MADEIVYDGDSITTRRSVQPVALDDLSDEQIEAACQALGAILVDYFGRLLAGTLAPIESHFRVVGQPGLPAPDAPEWPVVGHTGAYLAERCSGLSAGPATPIVRPEAT